MGWIPTIRVENEAGRTIRINASDEVKFGLQGYRRVEVEEPKDENLETSDDLDKEKVDGEKVTADDQAEVVPPEALVSDVQKEAKDAAEIATE